MPDKIRVPDGTTGVAYTDAAGNQVAITVKASKAGTFALPATPAESAVLAGFGWPAGDGITQPDAAEEATTPQAEEG